MDKQQQRMKDAQRLREEIIRNSPSPSSEHNALVMKAARDHAANKKEMQPARQIRWLTIGTGIAATILLGVFVLQMPFLNQQPVDDSVRGSSPSGTGQMGTDKLDSGRMRAWPAGDIVVANGPDEFRWGEQTGGERYQVTVYNDSAELLWTSPWTTSTLQAAPSIGDLMFASGARYFWVVEIDGASTRQSLGPYWFRVE